MQISTTRSGPHCVKQFVNALLRVKWRKACGLMAAAVFAVGVAAAASPRIDEAELLNLGFKVLIATTKVQQDWVRGLPPGKFRSMQRTGKKYFIYPDASKNQ